MKFGALFVLGTQNKETKLLKPKSNHLLILTPLLKSKAWLAGKYKFCLASIHSLWNNILPIKI